MLDCRPSLRGAVLGPLATLVVGVACGACGGGGEAPTAPGAGGGASPRSLVLALALPALDTLRDGRYEAWLVGADGTHRSLGRFTTGGSRTVELPSAGAAAVEVTVEPPHDTDPGPSEQRLLTGALQNGHAVLSYQGAVTQSDLPLRAAPGQFTMFTPSDNDAFGYPSHEESGVWLFNMAPGATVQRDYYVRMTQLQRGWTYEGWMVRDIDRPGAVWLSYGKFAPDWTGALNTPDDTGWGPFSGVTDYRTARLEDYPGDDWISNPLRLPWVGLPLPLDLRERDGSGALRWTHVVTIEPATDRGEARHDRAAVRAAALRRSVRGAGARRRADRDGAPGPHAAGHGGHPMRRSARPPHARGADAGRADPGRADARRHGARRLPRAAVAGRSGHRRGRRRALAALAARAARRAPAARAAGARERGAGARSGRGPRRAARPRPRPWSATSRAGTSARPRPGIRARCSCSTSTSRCCPTCGIATPVRAARVMALLHVAVVRRAGRHLGREVRLPAAVARATPTRACGRSRTVGDVPSYPNGAGGGGRGGGGRARLALPRRGHARASTRWRAAAGASRVAAGAAYPSRRGGRRRDRPRGGGAGARARARPTAPRRAGPGRRRRRRPLVADAQASSVRSPSIAGAGQLAALGAARRERLPAAAAAGADVRGLRAGPRRAAPVLRRAHACARRRSPATGRPMRRA